MYNTKNFLIILLGLILLNYGITLAQTELEPNDNFATATLLVDNTESTATFSSTDDVDIWKMELTTEKIYNIVSYSEIDAFENDYHVELFFAGDTTTNINDSDLDGENRAHDFSISGYVPFEFGSGTYYIRLTPNQELSDEPAYSMRLNALDYNTAVNLHEPDNSFQEAFQQFALPTDGNGFQGMLYNPNEIPTGKDDVDYFYMTGEQGKRLWIEAKPYSNLLDQRVTDTYIFLWDGDGNVLLAENDDKPTQEYNYGFRSYQSLLVVDSLPYTGLYYVVMTSYNSSYHGELHSMEDPSTGGYQLFAFMGNTKTEVEPNDAFDDATPVVEGLNGNNFDSNDFNGTDDDLVDTQLMGNQNIILDANFSSDGDVDYYAFYLKKEKWYTFNTTNSSVAEDGDIKLAVYNRNDPGTNLIDDSVEGEYGNEDFRLSGWAPPEDGVYVLKVSPASGSIGGANTGDYQLRMGWATWRLASEVGEPDDNTQGGAREVEFDNTLTNATIYPAGDEDWYSFSGTAGDVIEVRTSSTMDYDGTWYRDLDTKMTLIDPSGNIVENDDYEGDNEDNQFSGVVNYTLQSTGLVYVKVEGYYKENDKSDGENAIGTYRLFVSSSAAAAVFLEKEPNNTFASAMQAPENKDVVSTFSSSNDIDIFAYEMVTSRMYFVSSKDNTVAADIHAEFFAASDTLTNLLDSDIDGGYKNKNFRLSGFIPPADGIYYMKLSCADPGQGAYTIRARSANIAEVGSYHEPDNTLAQADALGDYPIDGVTMTGALYNKDDAEFENDLDIYRFNCTAGQMFVAETAPVGGPKWNRDTDTFIQLVNAAGDLIAENDDENGVFSYIAEIIPADGVYYLKIMSYSTSEGDDPTDEDPSIGDYLLTVKGTMSESEPNNSAANANLIPVLDNNLIEASFATDDLEDWFKVELEKEKIYYFNSTDSKVSENIIIEVFAEGSETNIIADGDPMDSYDSNDFALCGWSPPATGTYLFKLSVPISAIDDQNTGEYKLRAAGGEVLADVAILHEPDNSMAEADQQTVLSNDGTLFQSAFGDDADHDIYTFNGTVGESLELLIVPAHGKRWIRDLDTVMDLLDENGNAVDDNDDYTDWYEENFYNGEVENVYSGIFIDSLPYTGTYYVDVYPYRGSYNGEEAVPGENAVGSYQISVTVGAGGLTGVNETDKGLPTEFALSQNYPNPFNPTTTIQYSLREPVDVKIFIYNILGQKVATLVNTPQKAGNYRVIWDSKDESGHQVSSGIYFYRLSAGSKFVETKKLILLK